MLVNSLSGLYILVLLHYCSGSGTTCIRHPLCTRKIDEGWFVISSFFVLVRLVAQRWDIISVFFWPPSLNAFDSNFIVLISWLSSFGLQWSVVVTLSFTGRCCWLRYTCSWISFGRLNIKLLLLFATAWSLDHNMLLLKNWLMPTRTLNVFSQGLPKLRVWSPGCSEMRKIFHFFTGKKY